MFRLFRLFLQNRLLLFFFFAFLGKVAFWVAAFVESVWVSMLASFLADDGPKLIETQ